MTRRLALLLAATLLILGSAAPASAANLSRSPGTRVTIDGRTLFAGGSSFVARGGGLCGSGTVSDDTQVIDLNTVLVFDVHKTFTCDNGSGTFEFHVVAAVHLCDQMDAGIWTVMGGTGDYRHLHGAGTVVGTYFPTDACSADGIDDHFVGFLGGR